MAITEAGRHRLYQRLEELLGPDEATTLMEHLPPIGWADVATKRDIEQLRADLDQLRAATKHDIEQVGNVLRVEIARELRNFMFANVAMFSTVAALAVAAARLV